MKKAVFFTHSTYQQYIAELVVTQMGGGWEFLLIAEAEAGTIKSSKFSKIIYLRPTNGRWFGHSFAKSVTDKVDGILVEAGIDKGDCVLLSDLDWPLNNYICAVADEYGFNVSIFEDGVGVYVRHRVKLGKMVKMMMKVTLSLFDFSIYSKPVFGHYLGINCGNVFRVYSLRPIKYLSNAAVRNILIARPAVQDAETSGVLILDQPWRRVLSNEACDLLTQKMSSFLNSLDVNGRGSVQLKRHPRDVNGSDSVFTKSDIDYQLVLSNECAENYINLNRKKVVVSFYSTALINIKQQFPEIRVVSIGLSVLEEKLVSTARVSFRDIEDLFVQNNVEMYK